MVGRKKKIVPGFVPKRSAAAGHSSESDYEPPPPKRHCSGTGPRPRIHRSPKKVRL